ncbi:MAG: VOC family protein [Candidatus Kariarchaeaceae archaeon]|jgi:catechol 2,3-dioxygenase-like lactoylglutathione lyase family enzyme
MFQQFSNDILVKVQDLKQAVGFFEKVLGFEVTKLSDDRHYQVQTGTFNLFLVQGDSFEMVTEIYVDDLSEAKSICLDAGCTILSWDDTGNHLKHSSGFAFNLYQK